MLDAVKVLLPLSLSESSSSSFRLSSEGTPGITDSVGIKAH